MKKLFFLITIFAVPILLSAGPKLKIENDGTHNWGDVKLVDNPLKTQITISNEGDSELVIQNVKPSCGCTTAPIKKDRLAPGESTQIDVSLKVSHGGPIHKTIRVATNDPSNPNTTIRLMANVLEMLKIKPNKVMRFKSLEVGKESISTLQIHNEDKKPIKITDIKVEPTNLMVTFFDDKGKKLGKDAVINPGSKVDIQASITPQKSGHFRAKIFLNTDHPDHKSVRISGYGNVKESAVFNK